MEAYIVGQKQIFFTLILNLSFFYFEEKTTKLQDDIETHNANIQKHQETVDEHRKDVQEQMNFFKKRRKKKKKKQLKNMKVK